MLQKPFNISLRGLCIDSAEDNEVSWQVSGDIQTAFKMDILLNIDNSLAWTSNKINSYSLKYVIPKNTLTNGIEYKIKLTIYNQANESITSDGDVFQTSSRPVVTVNPIGTVNSFSYNFVAQYSQSENVSLRNYTVNLYDSNQNLIDKSNIKTILPIEHLFSGLQTETDYYIEFIATSSKGLTGTSGLVLFSVFYYRPKMNVFLDAKNIDNAGIEISWFVRQIILENSGGVFVNNDEIDLTNGVATGDKGFTIDKDFSLKLWLRDYQHNTPLLTLTGENGQIVLKYNAIQQAFIISKITNIISGNYQSKKTVEYAFVSPYQIVEMTGSKAFVLIQQIDRDINLDVKMYD